MRKKIIFFLLTLFLITFSQSEDIISTIPRRDKAHLDIEVTKIKTENLEISDMDLENKTLTLNNFSLDSSHSLLLGETSELFGSLFSVNGRLPALKNIARQTNLSYTQESNGEVIIHYKELPSTIYGGLWNKNKKILEKIYQVDIPDFSFYSQLTGNNFKIDLVSSVDYSISKDFSIQDNILLNIGTISPNSYQGNFPGDIHIKFSNSNVILKNVDNSNSINGTLYFKDGQNLVTSINKHFKDLQKIEVILSIAPQDFNSFISNGFSDVISLQDSNTQIIISSINPHFPGTFPPGHREEMIFTNLPSRLDVNFLLSSSIEYDTSNTFNLEGPFNPDQIYKIPVGHIYLAANADRASFNISNQKLQINTAYEGEAFIKFTTTDSHEIPPNSKQLYTYSDIVLEIPYESLKVAYDTGLPITMDLPFILSFDGDKYNLGPYTIKVPNGNINKKYKIDFPKAPYIYVDYNLNNPSGDSEALYIKFGTIEVGAYPEHHQINFNNEQFNMNNNIGDNTYTGHGYVGIIPQGQGNTSMSNNFGVSPDTYFKGDLTLVITHLAAKAAIRHHDSRLEIDNIVNIKGIPNASPTLGPFTIIFNSNPASSALVIESENSSSTIQNIIIDHGTITQNSSTLTQTSETLILKRSQGDRLFEETNTATFTFGSKNGLTSLKGQNTSSIINTQLTIDPKLEGSNNFRQKFNITSTLIAEDIKNSSPDYYSGTNVLNITISN